MTNITIGPSGIGDTTPPISYIQSRLILVHLPRVRRAKEAICRCGEEKMGCLGVEADSGDVVGMGRGVYVCWFALRSDIPRKEKTK